MCISIVNLGKNAQETPLKFEGNWHFFLLEPQEVIIGNAPEIPANTFFPALIYSVTWLLIILMSVFFVDSLTVNMTEYTLNESDQPPLIISWDITSSISSLDCISLYLRREGKKIFVIGLTADSVRWNCVQVLVPLQTSQIAVLLVLLCRLFTRELLASI